MSDNKNIFKATTAGFYKFDNGKVNLIVKVADGCRECLNLAQELLKEKEAYDKLKAQLEKAEKILSDFSLNHKSEEELFENTELTSENGGGNYDDCFMFGYLQADACTALKAREYFKEINKGESK